MHSDLHVETGPRVFRIARFTLKQSAPDTARVQLACEYCISEMPLFEGSVVPTGDPGRAGPHDPSGTSVSSFDLFIFAKTRSALRSNGPITCHDSPPFWRKRDFSQSPEKGPSLNSKGPPGRKEANTRRLKQKEPRPELTDRGLSERALR